MGMWGWLKSKSSSAAVDVTLTAEEAELAKRIADMAGMFMGLQLRTASQYAVARGHDLKALDPEIQAFAFGVLCVALGRNGIPWYKSAPVLVQYGEKYFPEYGDYDVLAKTMSHFGTNPDYETFVTAGGLAMERYSSQDHESWTPADLNDLAVTLGLDRENET